jgi:hypothetical protein
MPDEISREYPVLKKPKYENVKIWRYMDFTKFVSLIDKQALFFPRIDLLGDKFEGSIPKYTYPQDSRKRRNDLKTSDPEAYKWYMDNRRRSKQYLRAQRKCTFINSWHLSEFESAAMWKLYLKTDEGIAIQSTYRLLVDSFDKLDTKVDVGMVRYVNYNSEYPFNVAGFPFICKRKSFEHEKELRAIVMTDFVKFDPDYLVTQSKMKIPNGLYVNVNLQTLIEKIYVSPTAERWFEQLVNSIVNKYDSNKPVVRSSLAEDPIY